MLGILLNSAFCQVLSYLFQLLTKNLTNVKPSNFSLLTVKGIIKAQLQGRTNLWDQSSSTLD